MGNYLNNFLSFAEKVRMGIHQKLGTSAGITNFELNNAIRNEQKDNPKDEFKEDVKKLFYTGPADFFKNHSKNIENIIEKHITKPIDELTEEIKEKF
jgi:hypothetical protein